jgi:hypothetical protein
MEVGRTIGVGVLFNVGKGCQGVCFSAWNDHPDPELPEQIERRLIQLRAAQVLP